MPYANNQRRRDAMTRERADAVNAYARKWRKDNYHKVKNERQAYHRARNRKIKEEPI
jgi:hypothetical protein